MKNSKAKQVKFIFHFKKVTLQPVQNGTVTLTVRRGTKGDHGKHHPFNQHDYSIIINDKILFPTTIDKDPDTGNDKKKSAKIQLEFKGSSGGSFELQTSVQLTDFLSSQPLSRTISLKSDSNVAQVDFACHAESQLNEEQLPYKSTAAFVSTANLDRQRPGTVKNFNTVDPHSTVQLPRPILNTARSIKNLPARQKNVQLAEAEQNQQGEAKPFQRAVQRARTLVDLNKASQKKLQEKQKHHEVTFKQEKKEEPNSPIEQLAHETVKSSTSLEKEMKNESKEAIQQLNQQVSRLEKQVKMQQATIDKLKKQLSEYENKILFLEGAEKSSEDTKEQLTRRLHEDIENTRKRQKQAEGMSIKLRQELELRDDELSKVKKMGQEMKLELDRVSNQNAKISKKGEKQLMQLKKQSEQRIQELEQKIKELNKIIMSSGSGPTDIDVCMSERCEKEKKQLRNQNKLLNRTIQDKINTIENKEKLISTYEKVANQRKQDSASINLSKEMEKWRAERLMLQQQIQDLKNDTTPGGRRTDEQLLTFKIEKQNLRKQLDKTKKSLSQSMREKETVEMVLKEKDNLIVKTKQRVVDLLNAVQEHGGQELYAAICSVIQ